MLTPLIGLCKHPALRGFSEVALLLERWAQSQDGRGQVVLLRGERYFHTTTLDELERYRLAAHDVKERIQVEIVSL
jgi:hypothetical protein